jgi:hypothetical protein
MLIDAFEEDFFDKLDMQAAKLVAPTKLYLLIDGAFVPGLHKSLASDSKTLLFASLPGCNDETADASPFLTPYVPQDKRMRWLLRRSSRWPMLSLIETTESLAQLSARLSAWCVVEADGMRFNFRFADTRRLPAIVRTLSPEQRAQFTGPATGWSYVARDGSWSRLEVPGFGVELANGPVLDDLQFAALVDDSRADEALVRLGDRGYEVGKHPSVSHARVTAALRIAVSDALTNDDVLDWCAWFWRHAGAYPDASALAVFQIWKNSSFTENQT